MKQVCLLAFSLLCWTGQAVLAQDSAPPPPPPTAAPSQVDVNWTPPALDLLEHQAAVKSNFTMDRTLLGVAAGLVPDTEMPVRQAVNKLDGLSVHVLRFGGTADLNEAEVDGVRAAFHQRGWKHLVSTTSSGGPAHSDMADVWLVLDGANVRGAVVLVEGEKSLVLVALSGNLSPEDLLHLRGHFGIPKFAGDQLRPGVEP